MSDQSVVEFPNARGGSGFSLAESAPYDKPTRRRVTIKDPDKGGVVGTLTVEFYVNRLDSKQTELTDEEMEDLDADDTNAINSRKNAKSLAECICSWDMYGDDRRPGFVGSHEIVPLTPEMIEMVPLWVRNQVLDSLLELVNPNLRPSKGSRRRS